MKTLIEKTIDFMGKGHPETKTIFNKTDKDIRYKSLTSFSGRTMTITFQYEEESQKKDNEIRVTIPTGTEEEIKSFILNEINRILK